MHEYDHHIGDYTRDTVGLSMAEDGCYRRLLDQYYARELPLSRDREEVYRLARAASRQEKKVVDYVLDRFFDEREDGWHNNRADRELAEHHGRSATARIAAEERWRREREREARKHGRRSSDKDANAMQPHSERNANALQMHGEMPVDNHANAMRPQCSGDAQAMRLGARARVPPSGLPLSGLPLSAFHERGSVVSQPPETSGEPPPTATPETANPAIENTGTGTPNGKGDGRGMQWSKPPYVAATAKTLGIARRSNEDDEAFRDRVYSAVQERRATR